MIKHLLLSVLFVLFVGSVQGQSYYWQQQVDYTMDITMDVTTNQMKGTQRLLYTNHSPDTLFNVYYHLYFNAFQPGSLMDIRSRTIADPDKRIKDRIYHLEEHEQGWHHVLELTQDGKKLSYEVSGTVLEVALAQPILPGSSSVFEMQFESQVPLQVRRSGRDSKEGIRYSMSQWFPKMAEYDATGWHTDPYVMREFYSPWGDFQVNITIDKKYVVGGTGVLQNAGEIGHGYAKAKPKVKEGMLTWKFKAERVHDFVWAADPDYKHYKEKTSAGPLVHYLYQTDTIEKNWKKLPEYMDKTFAILNETFSAYPYSDFSIIQGGDGGMEYPMATLITGHRSLKSLVGVSVHEICHSWLPMLAATNESEFGWIDEGFAEYASDLVMDQLFPPKKSDEKSYNSSFKSYIALAKSGKEEPLTTHADYFQTNRGYVVSSYAKGAVTLHQMAYIMGEDVFHKAFRRFFNEWKYKHPGKEDFLRVFEKESGISLDWYFDYWVNSTSQIDYAIKSVVSKEDKSLLTIAREGEMPMPLEVELTLKNGDKTLYYIPLDVMRGQKQQAENVKQLTDWPFLNPYYTFEIPVAASEIKSIELDPSMRIADVDRDDNEYPFNEDMVYKGTDVKK